MIPVCEDNEGVVQPEHCWHPGSNGAQAPQGQRCCHCGLEFRIQQAPFAVDKEHGKHGRHRMSRNYQLIFDTNYQDKYKADPESFEKIFQIMEKSRKNWNYRKGW